MRHLAGRDREASLRTESDRSMRYIANPVEVNAEKIVAVHPLSDGSTNVLVDHNRVVNLEPGMTARYHPVIGDYVVTQSDGYVYVNPKDVFLRKYRPAE